MRTEKIDVAPATNVERLCHVKLPTMSCIAGDLGQSLSPVTDAADLPGPLVSTVGHVCVEPLLPIMRKKV